VEQQTIRLFQDAIRQLHGAESEYVESVPVDESFEGQTVWSGIVHVFDLEGSSEGTRAYAWACVDDSMRQQIVTVLHVPPVDSPLAAVRAAIVQDARDASDSS
jgi:hypothetical protein